MPPPTKIWDKDEYKKLIEDTTQGIGMLLLHAELKKRKGNLKWKSYEPFWLGKYGG